MVEIASTLSPSCRVNVLHAFDGTHVLSPLKGAGIRATQLAHAALHLRHRFVLVLFHPSAQFALDVAQMVDPMAHERRAEHGYVRSHHQQLHDVLGAMHSAGSGQGRADAAMQDSDPGHRQSQGLLRAQQNVRPNLQLFEIDVRLVEAIEQNQGIGARDVQAAREVREIAEKGAQLHGNWNGDHVFDCPHDIEITVFDVGGREPRVGGNAVEVAFDGVGSGTLEFACQFRPAAERVTVQTCDNGYLYRGFRFAEVV